MDNHDIDSLMVRLLDAYISGQTVNNVTLEISISQDEALMLISCLSEYKKSKNAIDSNLTTAFETIRETIRSAYDAFKKPGRFEKRAQDALEILGFTNGKRNQEYDGNAILHEYLELILGGFDWESFQIKPPIDKTEAVKLLHAKYGNQSVNGMIQILKRELAKHYSGNKKGILPAQVSD